MSLIFLPTREIVYQSNIHKPFDPRSLRGLAESSYRSDRIGDGFMAKRSDAPEKAIRRQTTPRPRFITEDQVAAITVIVRSWPSLPMTWEAIRARISVDILRARREKPEVSWSRQALSGNALIKQAYEDRRRQLLDEARRGGKRRVRSQDPLAVILERRVKQLEAENAELNRKLDGYEAKFRRMVLNQHRGETTAEGLDQPLPERVERRPRDD